MGPNQCISLYHLSMEGGYRSQNAHPTQCPPSAATPTLVSPRHTATNASLKTHASRDVNPRRPANAPHDGLKPSRGENVNSGNPQSTAEECRLPSSPSHSKNPSVNARLSDATSGTVLTVKEQIPEPTNHRTNNPTNTSNHASTSPTTKTKDHALDCSPSISPSMISERTIKLSEMIPDTEMIYCASNVWPINASFSTPTLDSHTTSQHHNYTTTPTLVSHTKLTSQKHTTLSHHNYTTSPQVKYTTSTFSQRWWQWKSGQLVTQLLALLLLGTATNGRTTQGAEKLPSSLQIRVATVTPNGAELLWLTPPKVRHAFSTCWLHYGPLTESVHVQTQVRPADSSIVLDHLSPYTTYYAFLSCRRGRSPFPSNTVHFTPHGTNNSTSKPLPSPSKPAPEPRQEPLHLSRPPAPARSSFLSSRRAEGGGLSHSDGEGNGEEESILVLMSQRHMDRPRRDPHNSTPPTSIILGAVCGVVGFLIINVTVVMAVRQYSNRRARRRRLQELQLQQHGGYIYNLEELLNA